MQNILSILKKEFKAYFLSPIAYIFDHRFSDRHHVPVFPGFFIVNQADMRAYFGSCPGYSFFSCRPSPCAQLGGGKKMKTLSSCYVGPSRTSKSSSANSWQAWALIVVLLLVAHSTVLSIAHHRPPRRGTDVGQYIGAVLMAPPIIRQSGLVGLLANRKPSRGLHSRRGVHLLLFIMGHPFVTMVLPSALGRSLRIWASAATFDSIGPQGSSQQRRSFIIYRS